MSGEATVATPDATGSAADLAVVFSARSMGSPLRLTIGGTLEADPRTAALAWESVVRVFAAVEAAMSRFSETSEVTALNRLAGSGTPAPVSRILRRALVAADRAHRTTSGRFDPRVISDLDRLGYCGAPLGPVAADPGPVGRVVTISRGGRATLPRPVDLGGIGKGLALRWAADALQGSGARDFLLEAGGDLVARGRDTGGGPWLVGVEDPTGSVDHLAVIAVSDQAVATSSIAVNRWSVAGRTVHHLIDPRTGEPARSGLTAVTVAGRDPAWAEVWSKVLFIGGRSAIAGEARSRGVAAWWTADDGSFEMTPAARAMTTWVASDVDGREDRERRQAAVTSGGFE